MTEASTTAAVDLFQKSWRVYQDIIEHNYMFHREISAACRTMLQNFQPGQRLRILDLGCGDASMVLPLLAPDRIAFYLGCDLSQPALDIADAALETEQKSLSDQLADPASYTSATVRISEMQERYAQIDEELLHALERWEVLDGK